MQWTEQKRNELETKLRDYQFAHAIPYLLETTKFGIRCAKTDPTDYTIPGRSRVGGDPDLPPDWEWPMTVDGQAMTFLAQLNLQDLVQHDSSAFLPKEGMLSFFVGVDEPAYDIEHRVLVMTTEQLAAAVHRHSPEETTMEESFKGFALSARATLEPPNYAYIDYDQIESDVVGYEEFEEVYQDIRDEGKQDILQLFGYPTSQHDDEEYEAALRLLTGQDYDYNKDSALNQITKKLGGDKDKAKQEIEDIVMLLEIDTDDDVGFCWWDAGVLHYFIRKEDLLAGRFDRTYCSLYSS